MAYQPLYGVISDNQGYRRSTSSLRGRVDQVGVWINSYYGDVLNIDVRYIECEMPKVSRKGLTPKAYSEKVKAVKNEVESRHRVIVDIDLVANPHFEYTINGVVIPQERIRQLIDSDRKRFELQLDCLKTLRDEGKQEQAMQLAKAVISGRRW